MFTFTHDCTACDRRQLIFPSMITGVTHTADGAEKVFTCWCGAEQRVLVGAPAPAPTPRTERDLVAA